MLPQARDPNWPLRAAMLDWLEKVASSSEFGTYYYISYSIREPHDSYTTNAGALTRASPRTDQVFKLSSSLNYTRTVRRKLNDFLAHFV